MALATAAADDQELLFARIKHSDLELSSVIQLPDLPVFTKEALALHVDGSLPRMATPDPW
jgi:hypothetical protein